VANTLLDFRSMYGRLLVRMQDAIDVDEAKMALDNAWRELMETNEWSFLKKPNKAIATVASKDSDTDSNNVGLTNGSTTVTSSTITYDSTWVGGYLIANSQQNYVVSVDTGANTLTLAAAYAGTTAATSDYTWYKAQFALAEDIVRIVSMVGPDWALEEVTGPTLDLWDSDRSVTGEPLYWAHLGPDSSGDELIELWPIPVSTYVLNYIGMARTSLDSVTDIISDIYPVVMHLGTIEACRIAQAKAIMQNRLDTAPSWRMLATQYENSYTYLVERFAEKDQLRFGLNDGSIGGFSGRLSGRTDIDFGMR